MFTNRALGRNVAVAIVLLANQALGQSTFLPGGRVLLDAHNSYPESGRWSDRIDRALSTGVPLAIEQDLYWRNNDIVVAHDSGALDGAPTLEQYFFERIRPIIEKALRENRREQWPLITLNLDFKSNERPLLDAVWALLGRYEPWLTTATRTATPSAVEQFSVGPLLVLSGSDARQRERFHDLVPAGQRLRAFGGVAVPTATADNYARWVNYPWSVVEEGGQRKAGTWDNADSVKLASLVQRAHAQGLWIRFYTLDGFTSETDRGYTASYNFGSESAAELRWRAVIRAGVDFVATDQYERFTQVRSSP